jgi:thiamine pyrophosphate-dependent acetolactate synthase large subunit-like protein
MNKTTAIRAIIEATAEQPVIFTTGYASRIAHAIADRPNHFYMTGSMGLASSIGIGVALSTKRTTVVVDGDGSLLMNPVGLIAAGALPDLPLLHIVLDDGSYASTGGQCVPSHRTDLGALAAACGYSRVRESRHAAEFAVIVQEEIARCAAPVFLRCTLSAQDDPVGRRINADLGVHARRFGDHVRATSAAV